MTMRKKMVSRFLLLTVLICSVCGLEVNVSHSSYQAEEKQSITLDWTFTPKPDPSLAFLSILCSLTRDTDTVLFHFQAGVEIPQEDEEFLGRVWCDKDLLKDGRIRLHVSPLRMNDSGLYSCEVHTESGTDMNECYLTVSAAASWPTSKGDDEDIWVIVLVIVLVLLLAGILYVRERVFGLPPRRPLLR